VLAARRGWCDHRNGTEAAVNAPCGGELQRRLVYDCYSCCICLSVDFPDFTSVSLVIIITHIHIYIYFSGAQLIYG